MYLSKDISSEAMSVGTFTHTKNHSQNHNETWEMQTIKLRVLSG